MSPLGQAAAIIFIGGPLVALWYCYHHGQVIHLENPWLNLGAHVALFIFPLIWVALMFANPVTYEAPQDHTLIATSTFFERLTLGWWGMFVLWATPVVAIIILGHALITKDLAHPEILSTSFAKAWVIIVIVFCLGTFYWTMLSGKDQPGIWFSGEGLRTSVARFHEWNDIHHVSRHGEVYNLFNRANPAIPARVFKVRDPADRTLLERYLAEHQIRIQDNPSPLFRALKIGVLAGFAGDAVLSLGLRFYLSFSLISVVLISFGMGIILTLIFEKFRGVSKFGKSGPLIQFTDDNDTGDAPGPVI